MSTTPSNFGVSVAEGSTSAQTNQPGFAMDGAREILALTAGTVHIELQIRALEDAVMRNPLIESVCKTILRDRAQVVSDEDNLPKLFGETLEQLRVLPDAHTSDRETGRSVRKTAGALNSLVQGICELRNKQGLASHGRLADTPPLESVQAELVARSADAVVSFLFKAHRSYAVAPAKRKRIQFADNEGYNSFVDESHAPVQIFDLQYRPSEVLYNVDYEAYVDRLGSFGGDETEGIVEAVNAEQAVDVTTAIEAVDTAEPVGPPTQDPPRANE